MSSLDVAVVVSCRDQGRTLPQSVASAIAQTISPPEVLIADCASSDIYTRQVLADLETNGCRVVRVAAGGLSAAWNRGVRMTSAPYIVLLDAADTLEATYLTQATERLDRDPGLAFVSRGARGVGPPDEVPVPSEPDLTRWIARWDTCLSPMFRRTLWTALGGFDETLLLHMDVDFWIRALERGFRGAVVPAADTPRRLRPVPFRLSPGQRQEETRLGEQWYRKHADTVARHAEALLLEKERVILDERACHEQLQARRATLENELAQLQSDIDATVGALRVLGRDRVEFGDLRRVDPVSPHWGLDRGLPLDRYYIQSFLDRHRGDVRGRVLEIKDSGYTRMFGGERVSMAEVLDIDPANDQATIVADLTRADAIASDTYDCVILTQTLGLIYDAPAALAHVCRILKPGGVLLCTVPAAGRISYESPGLDGDYWRFTEASVRRLFADVLPVEAFQLTGFGNVLACSAFLYGLAPTELSVSELDAVDPFFPVVYGIRAVKPLAPAVRTNDSAGHANTDGREKGAIPSGAVLMYHRVATPRTDADGLCVTPDEFSAHLRHLREAGYCVLPLSELAAGARADRLPPRAVALTFDDGYVDALRYVAPTLADCSFPATFFIVTEALEPAYEFWWDTLARIFHGEHPLPDDLQLRWPSGALAVRTVTPSHRAAAHRRLTEFCYTCSREVRDQAIQRVLAWSGVGARPDDGCRPMTVDELLNLAALPGVSIGAHTHSHLWLPAQPQNIQDDQITTSKRRLEILLGRRVRSFSYPYGAFDSATVAIVGRAGFDEAVSTEERGLMNEDDAYILPRCDIGRWQAATFAERLQQVFDGARNS